MFVCGHVRRRLPCAAGALSAGLTLQPQRPVSIIAAINGFQLAPSVCRFPESPCRSTADDVRRRCDPRIGGVVETGSFAMKAAVMLRETVGQPLAAASRREVLARYRRLREISRRHHSAVLKFLSGGAVLQHARRIGLTLGKTIVIENIDHLSFAFDLAIHTSALGRSRAIDRYARSARFARGSDEALVLEAMQSARFCAVSVARKHDTAGLIVKDLFRRTELWLLDEGLEKSLSPGDRFATRLYTTEDFSMTAGVLVPIDADLLANAFLQLPHSLRKLTTEAVEDRRFAETLYRVAFADGLMEGVAYQDLHREA
jgi:hypothetical protein